MRNLYPNRWKIWFFVLFVFISFEPLFGLDLELRSACLIPEDPHFRKVYGKTIWDLELEFSTPLDPFCDCEPEWSCFTNLNYYSKKGRFTFLKETTSTINWALNFGLKRYFCCSGCLSPYFGLGIGASWVRFRDNSLYVRQEIDLWGFAFLMKSGVEFDLCYNFFLDLFLDYTYEHFSRPTRKAGVGTRSINTGGIKIGFGLGYQW